ncbi:LBP_cg2779 family protein [Lactobacillus apis]|uniref:LBP_cg2779 family protein n=1 Tax=Lactobacillus apis TaxID=303541 RepID=UPI00242EE6A5|nr:LBP_cg2779 family protein [Lactobacillus apis]
MNQQIEELSDAIITYQIEHHTTDTDLAFASHLSVEKIHAMKAGEGEFTPEEINQLYDFLATKR